MMRLVILIAVLSALLACTNTGDSSIEDLRNVLQPKRERGFVERFQLAAERQAPQLKLALLEFDTGSFILLDSTRDGIQTWITPDGGTLGTKEGILVSMKGFGAGLMAADIEQTLRMIRSGTEGNSERFMTFLSGDDKVSTRTYRCVVRRLGLDNPVLTSGTRQAILWQENCKSLTESFENLYWVESSGNRIVQTSQWTGAFVGQIATQVVE